MSNPRSRTTGKIYCVCCQQLVSASTAYRHRQLQAPPRLKALSPFLNRGSSGRHTSGKPEEPTPPEAHSSPQEPHDTAGMPSHEGIGEPENQMAIVQDMMSRLSRGWTRDIPVDEEEDECEDEDEASVYDEESGGSETDDSDLWYQLGEGFERDLVAIGEFRAICQ
jgi:hypothetical protein